MKKIIFPLVISSLLLFVAPGFAASSSSMYNPELRSNSMTVTNYSNLDKAGTNYAYWHRHHWHHRHWDRWHHHHHHHGHWY